MEILHFCGSRSFSGLEQYALSLAVSQKKMGKAVGFGVTKDSILHRESEKAGLETVLFDPYESLGTIKFWPRLSRVLKDPKLKVLHLHSTKEVFHVLGGIWLSKTFSWRKKIKTILQVHLWLEIPKKDPLHLLSYSFIDEIWCSSVRARSSLEKILPKARERLKIVRYGRDIGNTDHSILSKAEARKFLSLPEKAEVLGTVARLEKGKGILEFLDSSLPLVEARKNLYIVVIGGADPNDPETLLYAQKIKSWLQKIPEVSQEKYKLMGQIPDSARYLKAFDVYVLPSYLECFSLSLLDAQLAGLPVVGTDSGGTPDVVVEGKTGWLCKPQDVTSLTQTLESVFNQKEKWTEFGDTARSRVISEFDQEKIFGDILVSYGI